MAERMNATRYAVNWESPRAVLGSMDALCRPPSKIDTMKCLVDELCSPDLTLGRAKVLRAQLANFLEKAG